MCIKYTLKNLCKKGETRGCVSIVMNAILWGINVRNHIFMIDLNEEEENNGIKKEEERVEVSIHALSGWTNSQTLKLVEC